MAHGLILIALLMPFADDQPPSPEEIAAAYRSKVGEVGAMIPGLRWEPRRVNSVRGWSLKFKRLGQTRTMNVVIRRYRAVAKKHKTCAEYRITDTLPVGANPQIRLQPSLTVDPGTIADCR